MGEIINLAERKKVEAKEADYSEPDYWDDLDKFLEMRRVKELKARRKDNDKICHKLRATSDKK